MKVEDSWLSLVLAHVQCTCMYTCCMYLCMHHRTGCPNKVILYQAGEDKSVYVHVEYHPSVIRIHGRIVTGRIIVSSVSQTTCECMKWYWMLIQMKEMIEQFPCLAR